MTVDTLGQNPTYEEIEAWKWATFRTKRMDVITAETRRWVKRQPWGKKMARLTEDELENLWNLALGKVSAKSNKYISPLKN